MRFAARMAVTLALALSASCGRVGFPDTPAADAGPADASSLRPDGGVATGDAGAAPTDAGPIAADAGEAMDGGLASFDASAPVDAGSAPLDASVATCRRGIYSGHDYVYCDAAVSFADATVECVALGMHLVRIDDAGEQAFLEGLRVSDRVWIGASDQAVETEWRWADGTLFFMDAMGGGTPVGGAYVHWGAAEPNGSTRENCAMFAASGFWTDYPCDLPGAVLCESP